VPWLGLRKGCVEEEKIEEYLLENGIRFSRKFELELQIGEEWHTFTIFEVAGLIEGISEELAHVFNCPSLESGPHLVLGEISAKLWDEGAKVVFPDGRTSIVPIYTFDGFLDLRMPTNRVRGLRGQIIIGGNVFDLPLTLEDFAKIKNLGKKYVEKIEKAISVYGLSKILSREVQEKLSEKEKKEIKYEVDFEAEMALLIIGNKLQTVTIPNLILILTEEGMHDDVKKVYNSAPEALKNKLKESLLEYYELRKSNKSKREMLETLLKELGISIN